MKIGRISLIFALIIIIVVTGCTPSINNNDLQDLKDSLQTEKDNVAELQNDLKKLNSTMIEKDNIITELLNNNKILQSQIDSIQTITGPVQGNSLINEALIVVSLLANQDAAGLDLYASPTNGVRFSPYANVNIGTDIVLTAGNTIPSMFTNNTVYIWGNYDGSGESIANDPSGYYSEFIYDHDFQNPNMIGINTFIGTGNIINNISSSYPTASFVEFHFPGFDPQYGGMDWSSLILVFENDNGTWYLIGVVHNQWTI